MPSPTTEDRVDGLISDIAIALEQIQILSDEYTHLSAEMLSELDNPPPSLLNQRDVISAAFASIGALADRAEQRIVQAHRRE